MKAEKPFVIERTFSAPVADVWRAITEKELMKEWYFDLEEFKAEVGFKFQFTAGPEGREYVHLCEVTAVSPEQKLSYTWRYEGLAGNSEVTFELFPEGENTRLKLTHTGLGSFSDNGPDFVPSNFAEGWTAIIGTSLQDFLEKQDT